MTLTLALAGDTMLGRGVAERLREDPGAPLVDPALAEVARSADLFLLNLECCVSERGAPIDEPGKPFFFRAPPLAAERLAELGVSAVTLANNHVLDFGPDALHDTLAHLESAGIPSAGAGPNEDAARAGAIVSAGGQRVRLVAFADHPASYAAGADRPGIAFADLAGGRLPGWLHDTARPRERELVVVSPHWGPNMTPVPVPQVRSAAKELERAGATLIAGHSAHVPHGVRGRTLFDLGDFLDDYATDAWMRNDLSLLWLVELDADAPPRVEGLPLRIEYAFTRQATEPETAELTRLLEERCGAVGSRLRVDQGRLRFEGPYR